ncbi:MAG: tRNA uridine(34) 5-carboxymethylaminomethyl modification radical SAM/GNAT enzyme Elp3 [Chloroflexi bacterium]|nr:tRNA uridine(34) 5-carboxymethylaminomethyl modification radical SAM/GNAT enzyme Elp3 [Chloroflexota bacterium]
MTLVTGAPPYPPNYPKPVERTDGIAREILLAALLASPRDAGDLDKLASRFSKRYARGLLPRWVLRRVFELDPEVRAAAQERPDAAAALLRLLTTKSVRSRSGIVPISLFLKPFGCPAQCVYCPSERHMPKSYLSDQPAVRRALRHDFDAYGQVAARLEQLRLGGHPVDKLELIIQGGTFSHPPRRYREEFLTGVFAAANGAAASDELTLELAQRLNERAPHRVIGITVETRPDWITLEEMAFLRHLGVTRVELGVQTLDDRISALTQRGHDTADVAQATRLLRDAGFKVGYHLMPGLPGATSDDDVESARQVFDDPRFRPDLLKLYPCVVTRFSELEAWVLAGRFVPYSETQVRETLAGIKRLVPRYVRIHRVFRDFTADDIRHGSRVSHVRDVVQADLAAAGTPCRCIRCREVGESARPDAPLTLQTTSYEAAEGHEHFLEYVDAHDRVHALLRLRFPGPAAIATAAAAPDTAISSVAATALYDALPELAGCALVRELHTYGRQVRIATTDANAAQHQGLGRALLAEAERRARAAGYARLAVISGIGVRDYYRRLGYDLIGSYMIKRLREAPSVDSP